MLHPGASTAALFLAALGCGAPTSVSLTEANDAIVAGVRDSVHTAVGQLGAEGEDGRVGWFCSATLIAPGRALTAAHCLYDPGGRRRATRSLRFGVGRRVLGIERARTTRYTPGELGPWRDIAVLELEEESRVRPIPASRLPPTLEAEAFVIGFGATEATSPSDTRGAGTRRIGEIWLGAIGAEEIWYRPDPAGACYGDSGGPIVQWQAEGLRVVGVTSRGAEADCSGVEVATRVDAFLGWIE